MVAVVLALLSVGVSPVGSDVAGVGVVFVVGAGVSSAGCEEVLLKHWLA